MARQQQQEQGRDRIGMILSALYFAFLAAAVLLIGNVIFLLTRHSIPTLALVSAFMCFVGLAISVGAACLSHLVHKAAALQEDSDLTI